MDRKRKAAEEPSMLEKRPKQDSKPRYEKELGNSVFVVVNEFRGNVLIHVRKYDEKKRKKYPTKTGATLNPTRWNEFVTQLNEIDDSVNQLSAGEDTRYTHHLGGNWYVGVNSEFPCVNIRKFWLPEGAEEAVATRKGIAFGIDEFKDFISSMNDINCHVPELSDVIPCSMRDDHQNQLGMLMCPECNTNDFQNW